MVADVLSDVLRSVRLTGAVFFDVAATSPWVAEAPPSAELAPLVMPGAQHLIEYHVVTDGACWAGTVNGDMEPIRLHRGSLIIFPRGDAHVLSSAPRMRAAPDLGVYHQAIAGPSLPFLLEPSGGGPDKARLLCGFLGCDDRPFNPLLEALPRLLHIDGGYTAKDGWLGSLIEATVRESRNGGAGSRGILSKLSELIFMEAVRLYAEALPAEAPGWFGALRDPQIGQVLMLLHDEPERPWTLSDLARQAGMSRTVLAERFAASLGMPPMTYLTRWRMQLAAGMLLNGTDCIPDIAVKIGYESEATFSRAFKRCTGLPPASWRATVSPPNRC
jgi:AraC-like DNA-binding protein